MNALPDDPQDLLRAARLHGGARAQVVNRTHRVVREQALSMRELQSRKRGLWAPLLICSSLLLVVCYAVWGMLDGYDLTPTGIPDASDQVVLLMIWLLPVTAFALGIVWIRRGRNRANEVPMMTWWTTATQTDIASAGDDELRMIPRWSMVLAVGGVRGDAVRLPRGHAAPQARAAAACG